MQVPSAITYVVTPRRPEAHLFSVELSIPDPGTAPITLSLPAWIPGSYMIRDFARNIVSIAAADAAGPLPIEKLDKQTWRLTPRQTPNEVSGDRALTLTYEVYAWELTVRSAHLDRTHGYFNGPSLFLRVHGRDQAPCCVELRAPADPACADWRVATSLARDVEEQPETGRWDFGRFVADDYDDLIDHPVEMGHFDVLAFRVGEVPHWMAISGRHQGDLVRLTADLGPICAEHAALFGELPLDRYLFLTQVVGDGYGGLEHRFSTSLLCSRDDLPESLATSAGGGRAGGDYRKFLGLCSHEYFHLWNVKRIRPAVFADAGLEHEVHTRLLWAFEGITSYYDDLALVRSGRIDVTGYLELLAETITKVQRNPGRLEQTVAESSFDAWTKFYKQDENAPNAIVSYYGKGAITALALDLTIRRDTDGRASLDDVMRALWQRLRPARRRRAGARHRGPGGGGHGSGPRRLLRPGVGPGGRPRLGRVAGRPRRRDAPAPGPRAGGCRQCRRDLRAHRALERRRTPARHGRRRCPGVGGAGRAPGAARRPGCRRPAGRGRRAARHGGRRR
jgi:predicted metalloprotease with PDZ domain